MLVDSTSESEGYISPCHAFQERTSTRVVWKEVFNVVDHVVDNDQLFGQALFLYMCSPPQKLVLMSK